MTILTTPLPFAAAAMSGTTVTRTGAKPVVAAAPPPGVWVTSLLTAAVLAPGSSASLTVTEGLAADPVIAHAVVLLQGYGTFLKVDDWLDVGFTFDPVGLVPSMTARLGGKKLVVPGEPQPALVPGQWVVVQVMVSADQVAVVVGGTAFMRLPLAAGFTPPSPITKVRLGSSAGSPPVTAALLGLSDEVPANVAMALEVAELTGFGETLGGFFRAGAKPNFGSPVGVLSFVGSSKIQQYDKGAVYFTPGIGAVVVDGKIYDHYASLNAHNGPLGLPLTDVMPGTAPYASRDRATVGTVAGDTSSMARFEHGVIASSKATGTKEVLGAIARHWLLIGGPTSAVGLPIGKLEESRHGWRHHFQFGDIYESFEGGCAEVHGAILDRYEHSDAWEGPLGMPVVDESDILDATNKPTGRRVSKFEHGAIYWSPGGAARLLPADWNDAYMRDGGPTGPLGLPAHEVRQTGAPGGVSYVEFEHALMVHHPPQVTFRLIGNIDLILTSAKAPDIDDGVEFLGSDRDAELIARVTVSVDGTPKPGWNRRRFPKSGHAGKSIEFPHDPISTQVAATTKITVKFEAEDWDALSGNDDLGGFEATYGLDTLWGELGPTQSAYRETGHGGDGDVIYEYSMGLPAGPVDGPFRQHKWWQFKNGGTDRLPRSMYVEVFEDVEATHNVWDTLNNPLDALYFELAVKGSASAGNCYGMSSLAHRSLFQLTNLRLPLDRWGPSIVKMNDGGFPSWLRSDVNRDHMKQLGASVVGAMLNAIGSLDLYDPVATANRIADRIRHGDLPIISMLDADFSGGHAVLAYGLSPRPGQPDRILIADPNCPWAQDPDEQKCYIEADNGGVWRFMSASQTGPYGYFFDIPHGSVCAPTVTPMAEMAMAVESIVSALVILGGDSSDEGVHTNDAQSTLRRVPVLQGDRRVRWYGAQGGVPSAVTAIVIPHGSVPFNLYAATANHRVTLSTTFADRGNNGVFEIQRFDSARPIVTAKLDQGPTAARVRIATQSGRAMRNGWVADAQVRISSAETFRFGFTTVGAGLELHGLAGGRAPEVTIRAVADGPGSRYRLAGLAGATSIMLRPADMASPFGSQLLDVAGSLSIVDPTPVA